MEYIGINNTVVSPLLTHCQPRETARANIHSLLRVQPPLLTYTTQLDFIYKIINFQNANSRKWEADLN